jgi:hypothetical protein
LIYPWGEEFACHYGNFDDETTVDEYYVAGGTECDGFTFTAPVATFPGGASPYGVLGMSGNVAEWVADWYDEEYYSQSPETNPTGPTHGEYRAARGGAWSGDYEQDIRAAYRMAIPPLGKSNFFGFRCASVSPPDTIPSYDGSWLGNTDQGQVIDLQIERNGVRSITVGFVIPGCESYSPIYANFGTIEQFVEEGHLDFATSTGLFDIHLEGTFTLASEVSGTLEISSDNPCEQGLSTGWSAVPAAAYEPPPLSSELSGLIPDVDIPDELKLPEVGTENFYRFARILGQEDDWFLTNTFDSIYPIPAGWTITGSGEEDSILLFSKGGTASGEEPEIVIRVGAFWGEYQTSEEPLSEVLDAIGQDPSLSLVKQEVVDSKRAYVFYEIEPESGNNEHALIVFSQSPRDLEFRSILVFVDVQNWDNYYPIVRAIVENWAWSWDNSTLGITLPETLVE